MYITYLAGIFTAIIIFALYNDKVYSQDDMDETIEFMRQRGQD